MLRARVIPRLDIKGPDVVKGIQLEGLRIVGAPSALARQYYADGADELILIDTVASLYGRNTLLDVVRQVAREVFIPLTVGGGIRTLEHVARTLDAGADKVAVNTAAVRNPAFVSEAANHFGSQCIVLSIEAIETSLHRWEVYTDNGRQPTGLNALEWARRASDLGAGEILLTAIHRDGTRQGYDLELTRRVVEAVPTPVIASGGAGSLDHLAQVIERGRADAVAVATLFHYGHASLPAAKAFLAARGIPVRAIGASVGA